MGLLTQESNLDKAFIAAESFAPPCAAARTSLNGWSAAWPSWRRQAHRRFSRTSTRTCVSRSSIAVATRSICASTRRCPGWDSIERDWHRPPTAAVGRTADAGGVGQAPRCRDRPADARRADQPPRPGRDRMARAGASERPGALLVTSHDRAFLDGVADRIWELRDRRLTVVPRQLLVVRPATRGTRRARAQG